LLAKKYSPFSIFFLAHFCGLEKGERALVLFLFFGFFGKIELMKFHYFGIQKLTLFTKRI
jgi:hypothetical protein